MRVISFGCDPEIFVKNTAGDVCSAIGKFGGTKEKPKPIKILGEGFAVQEDNVLVEFNIPPAKNGKEFVEYVQKTVDVLSKRALRQGLSFTQGSAFSLKPEYLDHPKALEFGCEPDFNAYTGMANPRPNAPDKCLRSAGGHIAIGLDKMFLGLGPGQKTIYQRYIVKVLDMMWGIPSILLDDGIERKALYGAGGAYRPKPFGLEYRTLSNFWVFNPKLTEAMLNAVAALDFRKVYLYEYDLDWMEVAINTNNKDFAKDMIKDVTYLEWARPFI